MKVSPLLVALALATLAPVAAQARTAALVPGCPSDDDGAISACQWRRALWAAKLYGEGAIDAVIPSGAAAANPYVEAEALGAALRALGVPGEDILLETQARHTDENVAFALLVAKAEGVDTLVLATDGLQIGGMKAMADAWAPAQGIAWEASPIRYREIAPGLRAGPPVLTTPARTVAVPRSGPPSFVRYARYRSAAARGETIAPPAVPGPEPTAARGE